MLVETADFQSWRVFETHAVLVMTFPRRQFISHQRRDPV